MELPNNIMSLQNAIFDGGHAERDMSYRNIYRGPNVIIDGESNILAWDITRYAPHGPESSTLDNINHLVLITLWERSNNARHIDTSYAREICLNKAKPALIVQYDTGSGIIQEIADGNHRIYKAQMQGMKTYPAHKLTVEQSEAIRMPFEYTKICEERSLI